MKGIKYDQEKPDWSLIDLEIIQRVASVLTMGAKKYSRHNYDKVEPYRYLAATLRHITLWQQGEIFDSESGEHHLAHAIADLHILQRLEKKDILYNKDD
jgi:hypothetical protein